MIIGIGGLCVLNFDQWKNSCFFHLFHSLVSCWNPVAMEKDHITHHEKVMTWATVVMTAATLVMMYSGCQQSRLAAATEKRAEQEERKAIAAAKRQLQKAAFSVTAYFTKISTLRSKDDCIALVRALVKQWTSLIITISLPNPI